MKWIGNSPLSYDVDGRILDETFEDQLKEIVEGLAKSHQTMLFLATMTDKVSTLIRLPLFNETCSIIR